MTDFNLTPGSRYKVTSVHTREQTFSTEGVFHGITSLGSVDAMIIEVDEGEGRTELIPTHVILKLEVLEAVGEEDLADDDASMHYT